MTTTSNIPHYSFIKKLAEEALMSIEYPVFPIKVKPLINVLIKKDLVVHTFNQYTEIENIDYEGFLFGTHSKDGTLRYFPHNASYILLYNKNIQRERKTWTIAHELGHYYAKHHIKIYHYAKKHNITPDEIPEKLNDAFEQEANCFARYFLAPTSLIQLAMGLLSVRDFISIYTILRTLFRLSKEASYNVATDIYKLDHPDYSKRLCLKYEPAVKSIFSIICNHHFFNTLLLKYQLEIDSRDIKRRITINSSVF